MRALLYFSVVLAMLGGCAPSPTVSKLDPTSDNPEVVKAGFAY